jgi:hypothetical protein
VPTLLLFRQDSGRLRHASRPDPGAKEDARFGLTRATLPFVAQEADSYRQDFLLE